MPSHIDIRVGRWQKAIDTNEKAVAADRRYRKIVGPPRGFLNVYVAHNRHMLAYAAMMTGQRAARDETNPRDGRGVAGRFSERKRAAGGTAGSRCRWR